MFYTVSSAYWAPKEVTLQESNSVGWSGDLYPKGHFCISR